ncbi:MAG: tRNA pseudouridine(38-40) synthase TruA [Ignavibacteria bacterium]|jgi:tRNA pseudouridine38-40 synthase|nr:tRNA pseudouridine(38-40) synthase TruA [Ignavibacteria bacterium]
MKNYKIIIQYDGTPFCGWQIQKNGRTVQGVLTDALSTVLREKITINGSGRTDTGVHAIGQCANFRTGKVLNEREFVYSVNSILPKEISIISFVEVDFEFHPRFDARRRIYYYMISHKKSPFYFDYSMYRLVNLNIEKLNHYSNQIMGEHDFTSFAKTADQAENKVCTVYDARWRKSGFLTIFRIEADRFLHSMVRTIVGTLLKAHDENFHDDRITNIILSKDRTQASEAVVSKGLFLYKVIY